MTDTQTVSARDLVAALARNLGCAPTVAQDHLRALCSVLLARLRRGHGVRFPGLMTLTPAGGALDETSTSAGDEERTARLAVRISKADPDDSRRALKVLLAVIRKALGEGRAVDLPGIGRLVPVRRDGADGIGLQRANALAEALDGAGVRVEPEWGAAAAQAAGGGDGHVLLVLAEGDPFADVLSFHFGRSGRTVESGTSVVDALQHVDPDVTDLVILDAALPNADRLIESLKVHGRTSSVPLVLVHPQGTDLEHPDEFLILGDADLVRPCEAQEVAAAGDAAIAGHADDGAHTLRFRMPTTDECVDHACQAGERLFAETGLDDVGMTALTAAYREAIGNAAQHGNRHHSDLSIAVTCRLSDDAIEIRVRDSGEGFDYARYLMRAEGGDALGAARSNHAEGRLGALGIMLMSRCVDQLDYEDGGCTVVLHKALSGDAARAEVGAAS